MKHFDFETLENMLKNDNLDLIDICNYISVHKYKFTIKTLATYIILLSGVISLKNIDSKEIKKDMCKLYKEGF